MSISLDEITKLPERILMLERKQSLLEERLELILLATDDEVRTPMALKLTGLKSRTSLIEERDRPGTEIRYSKHGRSVSYSRQSCIDYRQARRLRKHQVPAMRVA